MVFARLGLRPPFARIGALRAATAQPQLSSRSAFGRNGQFFRPAPSAAGLPLKMGSAGWRFSSSLSASDAELGEILEVIDQHVRSGVEDAFYVVNLEDIAEKHAEWKRQLPRVHPFYAVKCNPDPLVLKLLAGLGANFDCASRPEMEAVLSLGVTPDRIIYANPCKQLSHLRFARAQNVLQMTFDSADELRKVKANHPDAQLLLRIKADDSKSQCEMGSKYGAGLGDVEFLLKTAKELDLQVVGVSYHVGSGCYSELAFVDAVQRARKAFDIAARLGLNLSLLDIGGGFPGDNNSTITFSQICDVLRPALDQLFPEESGVRIIAEPGRYYVGSSHTLVVNVIGRKVVPGQRQSSSYPAFDRSLERHQIGGQAHAMAVHTEAAIPSYMYYVNDGLYGSFNCLLYDHASVQPVALKTTAKPAEKSPVLSSQDDLVPCSIWGPTCDGFDCILKDAKLPMLDVGEWLYFPNMGAYTAAAGSQFNGFELPDRLYVGTKVSDIVGPENVLSADKVTKKALGTVPVSGDEEEAA